MFEKWRLRVGVLGGWLAGVSVLCVELGAPPRAGDFAAVLLIESLWVAFLALADAVLFARRRRMIRPDYVAIAVAVCALSYGLSGPVRWGSITGVALGALSVVLAVSLRFHRGWWTTRGTGPQSRATTPPEAGTTS
jgi:hypothetical protein